MSAFLCSSKHLSILASAFCSLDVDQRITAPDVFKVLADENIKSITYRYPDSTVEDWVGDGGLAFEEVDLPAVKEWFSLARCYDYQSCEHSTFKGSLAQRMSDIVQRYVRAQHPGMTDEQLSEAGSWGV